jgi:hypothetical protein
MEIREFPGGHSYRTQPDNAEFNATSVYDHYCDTGKENVSYPGSLIPVRVS